MGSKVIKWIAPTLLAMLITESNDLLEFCFLQLRLTSSGRSVINVVEDMSGTVVRVVVVEAAC